MSLGLLSHSELERFARRRTALFAIWLFALSVTACDKPVIRERTRPLAAGDTPGAVGGVTGNTVSGSNTSPGAFTGDGAGASTGNQGTANPGGGNSVNQDPTSTGGSSQGPTNNGGDGPGNPGSGRGGTETSSNPFGGEGGATSDPDPAGGGNVSGGTTAGGASSGGTDGDGGEGGSAGEGTVEPTPPFTQQGLLETLAECATQSYAAFETAADDLADACDDLAANPSGAAERSAAQEAWRAANASWQRTEVFEFGPAAPSTAVGGQNLRDEIYAFPLANNCRVDQQIVNQLYADDDAFAESLVSGRGLAALEYLLFYEGASNSCASSIVINTQGTWAALSADERRQRRAEYAFAAARDLSATAADLVWAWDPGGGDFQDEFVSAGSGSSVFPTRVDAFNAVTEGLFYIELETKDLKLGWPLGLVPNCINAPGTCPNAVESRFALVSTDNLVQNFVSLRRAFEGCGDGALALGFDDWLVAEGSEGLATTMSNAIDGTEQAVASLSAPLEQVVASDPDQLRSVHTALKAFTDELKTDFVAILGLKLPPTVAGDTD